jgi:hypothetical protein
MLVIRIELHPKGDASRAEEIGRATIANDGTGTAGVGNYVVKLLKTARYAKAANVGKVWKQGRVEGFARLRLSPYHLVMMAFADALGIASARRKRPAPNPCVEHGHCHPAGERCYLTERLAPGPEQLDLEPRGDVTHADTDGYSGPDGGADGDGA